MELANEKKIAIARLTWLTFYSSELSKLQQPEEFTGKAIHIVAHHKAVYVSLLHDALVLGLYSLFEKAGLDQKTGDSEKITLDHFIRALPKKSVTRATVEGLLKNVRSSSSYAQLCQARGNIIGHSNRKTLLAYVNQIDDMFPEIQIDSLAWLLGNAQKIANLVIDPDADFLIAGLHGVDELFELVRRVNTCSGNF